MPVPAPLRLCVRRSASPAGLGAAVVVRLRLPSDVGCIEEAVELVTRHCLCGHAASARTRFRLQVALSEALANAIVRGNREDGAKAVDVRAELYADAIRVHVTDEGPGFDPAGVPEPTDPGQLDEPGGRGLFLIRKLVDAVQFNPQGNSICMTLRRP
jgi:anti-sigma regulatory factor (Ser/Thr protein kinase)